MPLSLIQILEHRALSIEHSKAAGFLGLSLGGIRDLAGALNPVLTLLNYVR